MVIHDTRHLQAAAPPCQQGLRWAISPQGVPPSRARPVTTLRAHPACTSVQVSRSNRPLRQSPDALRLAGGRLEPLSKGEGCAWTKSPAMAARGSSFSPEVQQQISMTWMSWGNRPQHNTVTYNTEACSSVPAPYKQLWEPQT